MELTATETARKEIFKGHLINLEERQILLPNGESASREVVRHPPAAGALVINDHQEMLLVKQWREPIKELTLEIPAGMVDKSDASPLAAIKRELNEEAGLTAANWTELPTMHTSPGFTDEKIYLFYADTLTNANDKKSPDADEFLDSHWYNLDEVQDLVEQHQITDAKTLYAISIWQNQ